MKLLNRFLLTSILLGISWLLPLHASAGTLPRVNGLALTGSELSWDAQEGASGYNLYLDRRYFDTVKGSTRYSLTVPGRYQVVSFNDAGEFGSLREPTEDFNTELTNSVVFEGSDALNSVSYVYNFSTLLVYTTCQDVGPGESCIAQCPSRYETEFGSIETTNYMSGGACSTSDIVEADAFVSRSNYKCTVPTFSGEVVAQAICVLY